MVAPPSGKHLRKKYPLKARYGAAPLGAAPPSGSRRILFAVFIKFSPSRPKRLRYANGPVARVRTSLTVPSAPPTLRACFSNFHPLSARDFCAHNPPRPPKNHQTILSGCQNSGGSGTGSNSSFVTIATCFPLPSSVPSNCRMPAMVKSTEMSSRS
ncbi:hypothetical protein GWI33_016044 [Rhynchophorus ferrugineus]|uniref:Uncharacterized protein n=1 Tax=Rhynchophorus ferrugineus TaxID=354439 RepID=A0A834I182_RHYFE|nr:hypothetical protein GWI33_016044 [Rhynchophorus ferrugineus]